MQLAQDLKDWQVVISPKTTVVASDLRLAME